MIEAEAPYKHQVKYDQKKMPSTKILKVFIPRVFNKYLLSSYKAPKVQRWKQSNYVKF